MGHSTAAIQKGDFSEAIARAYYTGQGFTVLTAETHETHYDFVIEKDNVFQKVQVKTCVYAFRDTDRSPTLIRIRNKRGQNSPYEKGDYDILVGVWREGGKMFFFTQDEAMKVPSETISVAREDGTPIRHKKSSERKPFQVVEFKL